MALRTVSPPHLRPSASTPMAAGSGAAAACRKGPAVKSTVASSITASAISLPTVAAGAPWWVALVAAALTGGAVPLITQVRAALRDRREGRFDQEFVTMVRQIPDAEKRVQAMVQYRQLGQAGLALEQPGSTSAPSPPVPPP